jgi:hypothetical protein
MDPKMLWVERENHARVSRHVLKADAFIAGKDACAPSKKMANSINESAEVALGKAELR